MKQLIAVVFGLLVALPAAAKDPQVIRRTECGMMDAEYGYVTKQTAYDNHEFVTSCIVWRIHGAETLYYNETTTPFRPTECNAVKLTGPGSIKFVWLGTEYVKIGDQLSGACINE